MIIYFVLIGYVLILPLIIDFFTNDKAKKQNLVALFGMLGVFLVLALKAPTVGIDILGYKEQYYIAKKVSWGDFDYVYYEKGYILLQKIFSKIGFSFQTFTVFIYGTECLSCYLLISKFSSDAMLSVLSFICFLFFVFSVSGLRQTLAMSICIFSFLLILRKKPIPILVGLMLILLAYTIHNSALYFLIVPFVLWLSYKIPRVLVFEIIIWLAAAFIGRQLFWTFVNNTLKNVDFNKTVDYGGNFLFHIGIMVFCVFTYSIYYHIGMKAKYTLGMSSDAAVRKDSFVTRLSVVVVASFIILSNGNMLRAVMYINVLEFFLLPNLFEKYQREQRIVIKTVYGLFLIVFFVRETLAVNQLAISNYRFFWQM